MNKLKKTKKPNVKDMKMYVHLPNGDFNDVCIIDDIASRVGQELDVGQEWVLITKTELKNGADDLHKITATIKDWSGKERLNSARLNFIVDLVDKYNSIGFGDAIVYGTRSAIYIALYNAGYSDNEELDQVFERELGSMLLVRAHPHKLFRIGSYDYVAGIERDLSIFKRLDCFQEVDDVEIKFRPKRRLL